MVGPGTGVTGRCAPLAALCARLLAEINATVHGRDLHLERATTAGRGLRPVRSGQRGLAGGSTEAAERAIASVRKIHRRIHGIAPDGRLYRADDPELLTWVHTAEVHCFLTGYQTFASTPLTAAGCDSYYAEAARVAERLGATAGVDDLCLKPVPKLREDPPSGPFDRLHCRRPVQTRYRIPPHDRHGIDSARALTSAWRAA